MTAQQSMFITQPGADPFQNSAIVPRLPRDTTAKAAVTVLPRSGSQRRRVFDLLAECDNAFGGLTDEDMQAQLRLSPNSERPRRKELCDLGLVVDSGRRVRNRGGQECIVWSLSQTGRLLAKGAA